MEVVVVVEAEGAAVADASADVVALEAAEGVAVEAAGEVDGRGTPPVVSVASRRIRRVEGAVAPAFHRDNMVMPCTMEKGVRGGSEAVHNREGRRKQRVDREDR